jgi:uncharacterized protein YndB with AHSA1/START domain
MRTVANLHVTTPSEREIVMTRLFSAPRELVYDCYTKPELLKRWMHGPDGWRLVVCENDLRVGGAFRWVWRGPDGQEMGMGGVHREIVHPRRIVRTELFDEDWTGGEVLGTLALSEQDGRTTVTTTMLFATKEARDGALKTGMADGMGAGFDRLDMLLASLQAGVKGAAA